MKKQNDSCKSRRSCMILDNRHMIVNTGFYFLPVLYLSCKPRVGDLKWTNKIKLSTFIFFSFCHFFLSNYYALLLVSQRNLCLIDKSWWLWKLEWEWIFWSRILLNFVLGKLMPKYYLSLCDRKSKCSPML